MAKLEFGASKHSFGLPVELSVLTKCRNLRYQPSFVVSPRMAAYADELCVEIISLPGTDIMLVLPIDDLYINYKPHIRAYIAFGLSVCLFVCDPVRSCFSETTGPILMCF